MGISVASARWPQTLGSEGLAQRLQLQTAEPNTKNQTLAQWSDSAETMAARFIDATEGISANTECDEVATGKYFLKE